MSLDREGALAEVSFHWSRMTPVPSKPVALHRLHTTAQRTLRLIEADLAALGVDPAAQHTVNYRRTQDIGEAVAFLECDGLIVPSARWRCENLVLMLEHHSFGSELQVLETEEVDWRAWAQVHGFLDPSDSTIS